MQQPIQLTFTLRQADLAMARDIASDALAPLFKRRLLLRLLNVAVWAFGAAALVAIAELASSGRGYGGHFAAALFGFAGLVTYVAAQRIWLSVYTRAALEAMGPYPLKQTLSVGPEGIRASDENSEGRWAWSGVEGIKEFPAHVAIVVKGPAVLLVPDAAFTSQEVKNAFVALVSKHVVPIA